MIRTRFNDDWAFRPKVNRHSEMAGEVGEWTAVTLPHDAMIGTERSPSASAGNAFFVAGTWEYRKTFDVPVEQAGSKLVLEFEAVYRDAVVTVNGAAAAHRPYGYSKFFLPIDHLVRFGEENEVVVSVRAGDDSRWYSGAGIHRNVWLLRSGRMYLPPDRLEVRTPEVDEGGAVVAVSALVRNESPSSSYVTVRVEVLDDEGAVVTSDESPLTAFPGEESTIRRRLFVANPRRWGPDDPSLYTCRITLSAGDEVLDEGSTSFGIRSLSLDPQRGFRLNGDQLDLRGACVHHDNGPLGAAAIDRAEARRVELLKAAGFNAIRSAHNPLSPAMLDTCDRLGMLVMDETFDMWLQSKTDDDYALRFPEWWEADVEAMVRNDLNHPCVVMYSIGNEIPDGSSPVGVHIGRDLAEKVRSLDDTRFVTQAVSGLMVGGPDLIAGFRKTFAERKVDENTGVNTFATNMADMLNEIMKSPIVTDKTEEAFAHLDVAGYNYMSPRFEMDGEQHPNRVILGSETHPTKIGAEWPMVTGNPHVVGDFTWTGWDYLGEVGIGRVEFAEEKPERPMAAFAGAYPWLSAWCGDIDITGQRRPQSYYREIVYGLRTDPYIAVQRPEHHGKFLSHSSPWSWSDAVSSWSWPGYEGKPIVVEVYADADEVELLVNGRFLGTSPVGGAQPYRTEIEIEYESGVLEAVARRGGTELGRMALTTADGPVLLDARADRAEIVADPSDLAFVQLSLVDGAGSIHNTCDRTVSVEIDGPGVLAGMCSANPKTEETFAASGCTTFDGRALAVVRPTGAGRITVTATTEGCDPQRVTIDAGPGGA